MYQGIEISKPHKIYAIKVVDLRKFEGDSLSMLEQEVEIHLSINHLNVVKCYDVVKTKTNYFLILEFCPHGNLEDLIRAKRKLGLISACEIMDQVSAGFRYLTSQNIVHRDIKPANILKV